MSTAIYCAQAIELTKLFLSNVSWNGEFFSGANCGFNADVKLVNPSLSMFCLLDG